MSGPTMRAMAIDALGGVDRLALRELPRPEPAADEVLVRVATVGINRQDIITMAGRFPNPHLRLPHVPGLDPAGSVAAVGAAVTRVAVGDRVVAKPPIGCGSCELCRSGEDDACPDLRSIGVHRPGGLAEYVALPERSVFRIPDGVTFGEATAAAHSLPVALTLLRRVGVTPADTVLVTGASGAIGWAVVQLVRVLGARAIAAVGGAAHADAIRPAEPFAIVDYAAYAGLRAARPGAGARGRLGACRDIGRPGPVVRGAPRASRGVGAWRSSAPTPARWSSSTSTGCSASASRSWAAPGPASRPSRRRSRCWATGSSGHPSIAWCRWPRRPEPTAV
ncbi:MAG: alcohol dehydrogenase catalytic domain-containing protein [Chloroflexota bacterium]